MRLRNINFEKVWCGSGVLGFVGEGYWWTRLNGLSVQNKKLTFVTKTITFNPNVGNVKLKDNFRPKRIFPETLRINFYKKSVVNKFALANPGLEEIIKSGKLQKLTSPFFISFGSTSPLKIQRLDDFSKIKDRLSIEKFNAPYGIQINFSCPNLKNDNEVSIKEKSEVIDIFSDLNVPITIKLSPDTTLEEFLEFEKITALDGYVFSNTKKIKLGGLSGHPLKDNNLKQIRLLRKSGVVKPINAGGGVLSRKDAKEYFEAGAESVFIWSVMLLRPWRVKKILGL